MKKKIFLSILSCLFLEWGCKKDSNPAVPDTVFNLGFTYGHCYRC
jgi:hypothetical protein